MVGEKLGSVIGGVQWEGQWTCSGDGPQIHILESWA